MLYIREDSDGGMKVMITDYLTQLCKIFTDIKDPTLSKNFFSFIPYANFVLDVLKGMKKHNSN